jgi:hypothetical protein
MRVVNNKKVKRKYTRRSVSVNLVAPMAHYHADNPFVIEEGVSLIGNRGTNNVTAIQLLDKIKQLPVDKNVSVVVPKSVAESPNQVTNLLLKVKRMLKEDSNVSKTFAVTMRTFKDANGNYINGRIWRIS